jgi:putative ABC transport system permease protein
LLKNYIKIAWKVLLRRKIFTLISLFTIALTLMILMAFTAILDQIFRPVPPEVHYDRTLLIEYMKMVRKNGGWSSGSPDFDFLQQYSRKLPFVEEESYFCAETVNTVANGEKIWISNKRTDGAFWKIFNFHFLEGSAYSEDDNLSARPVAVISESTRNRIFGRQSALGKAIDTERGRFRVVGVVEDVPRYRFSPFADMWTPIRAVAPGSEKIGNFTGVYLTRSRKDFPAIRSEFQARLRDPLIPVPEDFQHWEVEMHTFRESVCNWLFPPPSWMSNMKMFSFLVLFSIFLFMVPPAVNLINLCISRILERAPEIGVRKAFGASSTQLVFQFVVENIFLTIMGGALGFAGAQVVLGFMSHSSWFPYAIQRTNFAIFLYGLLLIFIFGLISGLYPAWHMSRLHPVQALKGGRQ